MAAFMPPDSVMILALSFPTATGPSAASRSIAGLRDLPNSPRLNDTSSDTFSKALVVQLLRRQARSSSGGTIVTTMSWPATLTWPLLALTMPHTMLISVVLPAPFGPEQRDLAPADFQIDALQRLEPTGISL